MLTRTFWIQLAERALKTGAQSAAAIIGAAGLDVLDIDATKVIYIALLAMLASVLTSIGSAPLGNDKTSPSITSVGASAPASATAATTPLAPSQPSTPTPST
ncbi:Holin [Actinoplanes sp. TBRC 11911]|nr:Holin [Actinoplanes sp. TBRC 11911]